MGTPYKRLVRERDVREQLEKLPAPVRTLIERMIAEDPADRYDSMADAAAAIAGIGRGLAQGKERPPATPRMGKKRLWAPRPRVSIGIAGVVTTLLIGSIIVLSLRGADGSAATAAPTPVATAFAAAPSSVQPTATPSRPLATPTVVPPTLRSTPVGGYGADFSKWDQRDVPGNRRTSFDPATGEYHFAFLAEEASQAVYTPGNERFGDFITEQSVLLQRLHDRQAGRERQH